MTGERPRLLYIECDGQVYLVERDGRLTFPREGEAPCGYEERVEIEFDEAVVVFCVPELAEWPRHWVFKDDVPGMENVDPLVRRSVNASLVREVTGALVVHGSPGEEQVLFVRSSRGFAKGFWNMPGGFITFGETPEESVAREVKEECGIDIRVERLLGVYTARFGSAYFTRAHVFLARPETTGLVLAPDEIEEARWFGLEEAYACTFNPFARRGLEILLKDRS